MILSCLHHKVNPVPAYLAERLGDTLVSVDDRIDRNIIDELHSEKAVVMVIDCKGGSLFELYRRLASTKFSGSKVLYCLFISPALPKLVNEATKIFVGAKNFVLFGYDILHVGEDGLWSPEEERRLRTLVAKINGFCPFENNEWISFPYSARIA